MKLFKILSIVFFLLIIFTIYNLNTSNIDKKYDCFLSSKICIDKITYNNNYYYNLYLNDSKKTDLKFENENLFFIDFKEHSNTLYIITQESKIKNKEINEECKKINKPFKFPENEYKINIYTISIIKNEVSINVLNEQNTPKLIHEWASQYKINPKLEFIC